MHYTAAKGETDDHCYLWVPARRYLFCGDLIIWQAPNCGNPQKVQRYPVDWAEALEAMAGLDAEWLFPGHGLVVHGADAVRTVLTETARYLRVIIDQVLERMNAGQTPEEIVRRRRARPGAGGAAVSPGQLRSSEVHRAQPAAAVGRLVERQRGGAAAGAAGTRRRRRSRRWPAGSTAVVQRGRALLDAGDAVLAAHLAEWATRAEPVSRPAQQLKRDVYERRLAEERALMAQGIYRAAMNDAKKALDE